MTGTEYKMPSGRVIYISDETLRQHSQEWAERDRRFRESPAYAVYQTKIRSLLARGLDVDLEKLIKSDSPDALEQFRTIRIHQKADKKARYLAKKICEMTGNSYELSFGIATKRDDPTLAIHNIEPYFDQAVLPSNCYDSGSGVWKTGQHIAPNGEVLIGWAHSHGNYERFLSSQDHIRIRTDLESVGKRIRINQTEGNPEGDEVIIMPLLVYNARMGRKDKPHTGIAVGYKSYVTGALNIIINENVQLKVLRGKSALDRKALDEILMDRVWCLPPDTPNSTRYVAGLRTGSGFSVGKRLREFARRRAA